PIVLHLPLGRAEPSRWLPLVFLVWVNLHGGFFFGLLALGLLLSSSAVVQRFEPGPEPVGGGPLALRPSDKRLALLAAASVLVCLINPNGLEAFTYPLKYAFDTTSPFLELAEWLPPFQEGGIHSPLYGPAIAAFALAALIVMVSGVRRDERLLGLAGLALGGLTLAMSLRSRRFIPIFGMSERLNLGDGWRDIVEASDATYVLWPKNRSAQTQELLRSGRWRLLYEDVVSMLLIRADWPPPSPLRETPDSPWRRLVQADHAARTGQLPQAEAHLQRALEQMPHLSLACHSLAR